MGVSPEVWVVLLVSLTGQGILLWGAWKAFISAQNVREDHATQWRQEVTRQLELLQTSNSRFQLLEGRIERNFGDIQRTEAEVDLLQEFQRERAIPFIAAVDSLHARVERLEIEERRA